jgi:hypothetical protein
MAGGILTPINGQKYSLSALLPKRPLSQRSDRDQVTLYAPDNDHSSRSCFRVNAFTTSEYTWRRELFEYFTFLLLTATCR